LSKESEKSGQKRKERIDGEEMDSFGEKLKKGRSEECLWEEI
jgi:hypothetical protein